MSFLVLDSLEPWLFLIFASVFLFFVCIFFDLPVKKLHEINFYFCFIYAKLAVNNASPKKRNLS